MKAYWEVLETRDPRFVVEACEYAAQGKLGDPKFLPSAADLYQCAEAFAARAFQANRCLVEPPHRDNRPFGERQRVAEGLRQLVKDLRKNPIGSLACTPRECPKKFGVPCPNRGMGICRETTEVHFTPATDPPETLDDVKECLR